MTTSLPSTSTSGEAPKDDPTSAATAAPPAANDDGFRPATAQSELETVLGYVEPAGRWAAWTLIVLGVLSTIIGIVAVAYPGVTLIAVSILFGISILTMALGDIVESLANRAADTTARVLWAVIGVLGLIAGLIVLRHPGESLAVLVLAIGIYLFVAGSVQIVSAFMDRADRWTRVGLGALELVAGLIILAVPGIGLVTLAALTAVGLLFRGIGSVLVGTSFLRLTRDAKG